MHRIAGDDMNPTVDTAAKLSCFRFFAGASVLDTCMGLGRPPPPLPLNTSSHTPSDTFRYIR